jgi:RHS repeat-associated protein
MRLATVRHSVWALVFVILTALTFNTPQSHAGKWITSSSLSGCDAEAIGDSPALGRALAAQALQCQHPSAAPIVQTIYGQSNSSVTVVSRPNNFSCQAMPPPNDFPCEGIALYVCLEGEAKMADGKCRKETDVAQSCKATHQPKRGNPIEISSGRKIQVETDWVSGGNRSLQLMRYYASKADFIKAPARTRLGMNWRTNFDLTAAYEFGLGIDDPTLAPDNSLIHISTPDFKEYSLKKVAGVWKPAVPRILPNATNIVLWDQMRTDIDVAVTAFPDGIEFKSEDNTVYRFDKEGYLKWVRFVDGYSQTLEWVGKSNTRVFDSLGRVIEFEYWATAGVGGLLKAAILPDGQRIEYGYVRPLVLSTQDIPQFSAGDVTQMLLSSVVYPDATPTVTTDNPRKTMEYLEDPVFPWALASITDERGVKYASWTYDTKGRAITSSHIGNNDTHTFSYDDVNNRVTVTNPLGRQTVYQFERVMGMLQILKSVNGVATTNCPASVETITTDANGFMDTETDAEGRVTKSLRNNRGLPLSTTRGFGTGLAQTNNMSWDTTRQLPTQAVEPGLTTDMAYNSIGQMTSITETDTTSTTVPYASNGQTRTTTFNYTNITLPAPPAVGPVATALSDVTLTVPNGNASSGVTGWTNVSGAIATSTVAPCNVSACFTGGTSIDTVAQQDITIPAANTADIDANKRAVELSWKQNTLANADRAGMRVLFLNASNAVIGTALDDVRVATGWTTRKVTGPVPALTRKIRVQMMMKMIFAGTNDGYIDDIALKLVADGDASANPFVRLVNPSPTAFAAAPFAGWTGPGAISTSLPCNFFPCFADAGTQWDNQLVQTIALPASRNTEIDANKRGVEISWVDQVGDIMRSVGVDVEFLNSGGTVLPKKIVGATGASVGVFSRRTQYIDVPATARSMRVTIHLQKPTAGLSGSALIAGLSARLVARSAPSGTISVLSSVNGPLSGTADTTTYTYNAQAILTQVTDPNGLITKITALDANSRPTTIQDENGVNTTLTYNPRGWLTQVKVNNSPTTTIAYDAAGQVTRITLPDASYLNYTWSNAKRLTQVSNNLGEKIDYTHDAMGNVTSSAAKTSANVITKQMTMVYDELGRLLRSIGAANQTTQFGYDRTDLTTSVTDPRNNLYGYAYDSLSRLMSETDQSNNTVTYGRNGKDEIVTHTDPRSIVTSYVRNGFGDVIQETSPDTGTTVFVRDARGLVTQKTDGRGVVANMSYDNGGRLLTETYPAATAESVTYTYDSIANSNKGKGRLTGVTHQGGSMAFVYDVYGRVTSDTRVIGTRTYVTAYAYNLAGRVTQITYPSGRIITITRNTIGQPTAVTTKQNATATAVNVATAMTWRPMADLVASMTHGNGLITQAAYDNDDRLTQLQVKNGTAVVSGYAYAYGDNLNLTGITDQVQAANTAALWYTPGNRLQDANGPWGNSTYYYDSVGNRTYDINTVGATTTTRVANYGANDNRITDMTQNGAALRSYSHDGAGNIITDVRGSEILAYTYNNRNRLASVTRNAVAHATYQYNAFEQMVSRNTSAAGGPVGTVHYIYDLEGHLIAEADSATGASVREYIWLPSTVMYNDTPAEEMGLTAANDNVPDLPLAVVNVSATPVIYQVHSDHLGRPIRMTDAAKATVWQAIWKPWGEPQSITGTQANNLRFPGQYFQLETGLAYNWHRHYDPVTGRYIQPDPLRFVDGPSVYAYVGSSPYMKVDPAGLAAFVNNTDKPILVAGSPGTGHGHPDSNRYDDGYIPVLVPPGGRVDRCNPIWAKDPKGNWVPIHDVDLIDFNGDGVVKGSPYRRPRLNEMLSLEGWRNFLGSGYYYGLGEQVKGGDVDPIWIASPGFRGHPNFHKNSGPVDTSPCECRP